MPKERPVAVPAGPVREKAGYFLLRNTAPTKTKPPTRPRLAGSGVAEVVMLIEPLVSVVIEILVPLALDREVAGTDKVMANGPVAAPPETE